MGHISRREKSKDRGGGSGGRRKRQGHKQRGVSERGKEGEGLERLSAGSAHEEKNWLLMGNYRYDTTPGTQEHTELDTRELVCWKLSTDGI